MAGGARRSVNSNQTLGEFKSNSQSNSQALLQVEPPFRESSRCQICTTRTAAMAEANSFVRPETVLSQFCALVEDVRQREETIPWSYAAIKTLALLKMYPTGVTRSLVKAEVRCHLCLFQNLKCNYSHRSRVSGLWKDLGGRYRIRRKSLFTH